MWRVLSFIGLAVFMLFVVMWMLLISGISYVSYIVAMVGLVIVCLVMAMLYVIYRDKRNEVLRMLNPDRSYQVVFKVFDVIGHEYVMSVIDLTTREELIACIHYSYPPHGFF